MKILIKKKTKNYKRNKIKIMIAKKNLKWLKKLKKGKSQKIYL